MELNILSEQFFSNYIFHPRAKELTPQDQRKALISSIVLGVLTLGICHLVCLIKYRNRTFKLGVEDPVTQRVQTVSAPHVSKAQKPDDHFINSLLKSAEKDGDAFLVDFSKVRPNNISNLFSHPFNGKKFGDIGISDKISYDESGKFTHNFPYKYRINIVTLEKNESGLPNYDGYMFTMNDEGKVESYGRVFDNFSEFLGNRINSMNTVYQLKYDHFDILVRTENGYIKLRKKSD